MRPRIKTKVKCIGCGKFGFLVKKEDLPTRYKTKAYKHIDLDRVYHCKHCEGWMNEDLPRYMLNKK
jgi:hypothetical protein